MTCSDEPLFDDSLRERPTMECRQVVSVMFSFLDAQLSATECDEIRLHLFACDDCLGEYDSFTVVRAVVKRSCQPAPAPEALRRRLVAHIRRKPPT